MSRLSTVIAGVRRAYTDVFSSEAKDVGPPAPQDDTDEQLLAQYGADYFEAKTRVGPLGEATVMRVRNTC